MRKLLLRDNEETAAWREFKEQMVTLEIALKKKARHKFSLATPLHPLQLDQTIQPSNTRRRARRFKRTAQRNIRIPTRNDVNDQDVTTEFNLPDLSPINLTSSELTDAECSLLKKGPAFCPVPKDVNWQKVTDDLEKFERRIRLVVFFQGRNAEDNPSTANDRFPAIPSASQRLPPKSIFPEVEVFFNNVKNDIFKPANFRTSKDNLTREERLALRSLKYSENIIRILDKGSRFVVLSQQEYQNKILTQLNNDLHYDSLDSDPTLDHFEVVKEWSHKWFSGGQISQEIATWVVNLEPKPGVAFGNVKTHKRDNPLRLLTSC